MRVRQELDMMMESGASVTVINEDMAKAVTASDAKPNGQYIVADGTLIENVGQKTRKGNGGVRRRRNLLLVSDKSFIKALIYFSLNIFISFLFFYLFHIISLRFAN